MKIHVRYISLRLFFHNLFISELNLSSDKYNCILYRVPSKLRFVDIKWETKIEHSLAIPYYDDWLLGSMQPIVDCWDDFADTAKPYKSIHHAISDALQPVFGILNILYGFVTLGLSLLYFLFSIAFIIVFFRDLIILAIPTLIFYFLSPPSVFDERRWYHLELPMFSFYMFCYLLEGISTLTRGLLQLITFPLTWLIKIPLRALLLTPILGFQKFEEDRGINRLLVKSDPPLIHINGPLEALVDEKIRNKIERATEQGRKLPYDSISENISFFRSKRILNFLAPATHFTMNSKKFNQLTPNRQLEVANKLVLGYQRGDNAKQETDNIVKILKQENLYAARDIRTLFWAAEKGHIKDTYKIPKDVVKVIARFMRPL
jgi:hypothetical protein